MEQLAPAVPRRDALHGRVQHRRTFVSESVKEVVLTLLLSIVPRRSASSTSSCRIRKSTLIPAATIPVSLIGTFFVMKLFGFTINTITLFGLTLATGLVVDDAIVVIENIARHIEMNKGKQSGVASAAQAMREIQSAVVASSLVLLAVFIPVGFFPGTTGQLYKQFALTIAASITISLFQALTLAPVLSARLLTGERRIASSSSSAGSTRGFDGFRDWYARRAAARDSLPLRWRWPSASSLALLLDALHVREDAAPASFPTKIKATSSSLVQAPEGTSLAAANRRSPKRPKRSSAASREVKHLFDVGGFSFSGAAPNRGIMFALLKPWGERKCPLVPVIDRRASRRGATQPAVAAELLLQQDPAGADLRVQSAGDQRRRQLRRLPVRTRRPRQRRARPRS